MGSAVITQTASLKDAETVTVGMRKAEIIEFATTNKIEINEKATIAEITDVITKAMEK